MSLILESTIDNINWFIEPVLSEYLLQNKSTPNFINLKWIISDFDENVYYEQKEHNEQKSDYYNNIINMQVDYYINNKTVTQEIKNHFLCKTCKLLNKLFSSHNKVLCE